jgi:hypothetical protein
MNDSIRDKLTNIFSIVNFMSYDKKSVLNPIRGNSLQLIKHLIKLLIMDRGTTTEHWIEDCEIFCNNIYDLSTNLKTNKGILKKDILWKLIYHEPIGDINSLKSLIKGLRKKYNNIMPIDKDISHDKILFNIKLFCEYMINEYIYGDSTSTELIDKLKSIPELNKK